jgi:hypothetical protein
MEFTGPGTAGDALPFRLVEVEYAVAL